MRLTLGRWRDRRKISITGITRFSTIFCGNHPFRDKHEPFDVRVATLFDETRLRRRFDIWEAVTLPSLAAQSDGDFGLIVVTSSLLPEWARMRLEQTLSEQPFPSRIAAPAPNQIFPKVIRQNVRALARDTYGIVGTFRLDDDDALAADYVARLRAEGASGQRISPPVEIYGFENGWFLAASEEGLKVAPVTRSLIACGLGRMSGRKQLRTIHSPKIGHTKLADILRTRHCGGAPAWIVTAHDLNDSDRMNYEGLAQAEIMSPTAASELLGPNFAALNLERIASTLRC